MNTPIEVRSAIDWGDLAPLRFHAKMIADGLFAGGHRSARKGGGVEFGGHREYVPGDDLRRIDARSLMRHDRLLIRQFETETDRALYLFVDATRSMDYRGSGRAAKAAYAAVLAAALARVAVASGDPVGLALFGAQPLRTKLLAGMEGFDRAVRLLESMELQGDVVREPQLFDRTIRGLSLRRGAISVLFSDLLDVSDATRTSIRSLAGVGRSLVVVQVLDPDEVDLPFRGVHRFRSMEGEVVREADADRVRKDYREKLAALQAGWREELVKRGARFMVARTDAEPIGIVRDILEGL